MRKFFKQFSFPGHIGSHMSRRKRPARSTRAASSATACRTPTARRSTIRISIVACVVGDGEAETGPLATAWHSNKFINPVRDGAVLPILNLNGYKIANPTILARISHEELEALFVGYGYTPLFRRRRGSRRDAPEDGRDAGARHRRDPRHPAEGRAITARRAPALADDRAALAQGLDRPEGDRRPQGRRARGARTRCRSPTCARIPAHLKLLEELAAKLQARGAVRRERPARAGAQGARAHRARGA